MPSDDRTRRTHASSSQSQSKTELYSPTTTVKKPATTRNPLIFWGAGISAGCLLVMCCGGAGVGLVWWGRQPAERRSEQTRAAEVPLAKAEEDRERKKFPAEADPEKEAFIQFVHANAQNPDGLEIISWGEKQTAPNGNATRSVRFRCKLIGIRPNLAFQPGVRDSLAGSPVMLENTRIIYSPSGKIKSMDIPHCGTVWHAE